MHHGQVAPTSSAKPCVLSTAPLAATPPWHLPCSPPGSAARRNDLPFMSPDDHSEANGAGSVLELRRVSRQARAIWGLVPFGLKLGLGGAAIMMVVASACSTVIPLLVGLLVDSVQ